ncbi:aspartate/glutamate racemase family protein [Niabella terrae]
MRKLGLVGGISWVSTADYYKYINTGINARLGGLNFAECLIYSLNFQEIHDNNQRGDWESTFALLLQAADALKAAGAEGLVLCANTMHLLADRLQARTELPLINILTATCNVLRKQGLKKVGLLGTRFTMQEDFFKDALRQAGITPLIPEGEDFDAVVKILDEELHLGIVTAASKARYLDVIEHLAQRGAEGVILGCTEIPLLIQQEDLELPVFDTTKIHAAAAVEFALS